MTTKKRHFDLAVVVINFRTPELTTECLRAIVDEIVVLNACVVLVDNNSGDGSIDKIEESAKALPFGNKLIICRSPVNGGFSAGNNVGIKAVDADYYLLLNSDTIAQKSALSRLLATARADERVGLLGPRLLGSDGNPQSSCFRFHTPFSELINAAKTRQVTELLQAFVVPQLVSDTPKQYQWLSFACIMVKAEVLQQVGLLDEGYFMYYEDVEFCHRVYKQGWVCQYEPGAQVVHLQGGTSKLKRASKLRKRLPRYFYESRARFFFQTYGRAGLLMANLLCDIGCVITALRALFSSTYEPDIAERQWQDVWTNFLDPLKPYVHPENYGKKT